MFLVVSRSELQIDFDFAHQFFLSARKIGCVEVNLSRPKRGNTDWKWVKDGFQASRFRSSHRRCSMKKAALKDFVVFTGKHLCLSLFLIKLQA